MSRLAQSEAAEVICGPQKLFVCNLRTATVERRDVCFAAISSQNMPWEKWPSIHRLCMGRHLLNEICA